MVKTVATAVIGVGHMVVAVAGTIFGHLVNFTGRFYIGGAIVQIVYIAIVHTDDQVEFLEVGGGNGSRNAIYVVATLQTCLAHAIVGSFALVIG